VEVRFVQSRTLPLSRLASRRHDVLPGREIEFVDAAPRDHLFLVSSEPALSGRGVEAMRALAERRVITLTDTVNQRGAIEAGLRPSAHGLSAWEMLQAGAEGRLRALVVFGDDPLAHFPALTAEALARMDFVVVVDAVKTRTAARADAVLPGAVLAEKRGCVVSGEGRVQEVVPVADPPAEWSEGRVAELLADRLDGAVLPGPPEEWRWGGETVPLASPSEAYPYVIALDTGTYRSQDALVNATVTAQREAARIRFDHPSGFVSMHPEDRKNLGLSLASPVSIASARGSVTLPARTDPDVLPGTLWIPMAEWERTGKALGALGFDPVLRIPVFRPTPVRVAPSEH
jgi:predicted molibdopterin-dependent oxidoreductase YjgC